MVFDTGRDVINVFADVLGKIVARLYQYRNRNVRSGQSAARAKYSRIAAHCIFFRITVIIVLVVLGFNQLLRLFHGCIKCKPPEVV